MDNNSNVFESAFISYARKNQRVVDNICAKLEIEGVKLWIDRSNLYASTQWQNEIVQAIDFACVFIVFISKAAAKSKYVLKELQIADSENKIIIPVYLESTDVQSMRLLLVGIQHIDFYKDKKKGYKQLVVAIKKACADIDTGTSKFDQEDDLFRIRTLLAQNEMLEAIELIKDLDENKWIVFRSSYLAIQDGYQNSGDIERKTAEERKLRSQILSFLKLLES